MQILFYAIWLLVLSVMQPTLARGIEIFNIAPNLFLAFVIIIGFYIGKMDGAICGAAFGLVYDMLIGRQIGVNAFCYLYIGFGAGILSENFFSGGKTLATAITVFAGTIIASLIYYFAGLIAYGSMSFVTAIFRIGLLEGIYNAIIAVVLKMAVLGLMKLMRIDRIS